jgi:hypothetical protein
VRLLFGIIPVLLFLTLAVGHAVRAGVQPDDAGFVALRVAENLRSGDGLGFNVGERRDLVDSPLWLAVLSVLSFSSSAPQLVQVVGLGLGVAVIIIVLAGPRLPVAGACACLFLALDGLFAARATLGGSATLAALYLLGLSLVLRRGRGRDGAPGGTQRLLAGWAAAAALVRYEFVLVAVPATLGWALADRRRRRAWLPLAAALAGGAVVLGLRWRYFQDVPAYWQPWPPSPEGVAQAAAGLADLGLRRPLLLLGTLVLLSSWLRAPLRFGCGSGLTWGLFALGGFALLPAAGGDLVRQAGAVLPLAYLLAVETVWRGTRTRLGLVAALLLVAAQPASTWSVRDVDPRESTTHVRLGQWLRAHALPGTVVGARQVGALGYYSRLQMEDVQGRVSARVAEARRGLAGLGAAPGRVEFDAMLRQEPDLVILGRGEPLPTATLYVPNLDAVPPAVRGELGVYRWAGSPVWRPGAGGGPPSFEQPLAPPRTARHRSSSGPPGRQAPRTPAAPRVDSVAAAPPAAASTGADTMVQGAAPGPDSSAAPVEESAPPPPAPDSTRTSAAGG